MRSTRTRTPSATPYPGESSAEDYARDQGEDYARAMAAASAVGDTVTLLDVDGRPHPFTLRALGADRVYIVDAAEPTAGPLQADLDAYRAGRVDPLPLYAWTAEPDACEAIAPEYPSAYPSCRTHSGAPFGPVPAIGPVDPRAVCSGARAIAHPSMTVREAAEAAGLRVYDYALPEEWCRAVADATGVHPAALGYVWEYDRARVWGAPYPLTAEAAALLARYREAIA